MSVEQGIYTAYAFKFKPFSFVCLQTLIFLIRKKKQSSYKFLLPHTVYCQALSHCDPYLLEIIYEKHVCDFQCAVNTCTYQICSNQMQHAAQVPPVTSLNRW